MLNSLDTQQVHLTIAASDRFARTRELIKDLDDAMTAAGFSTDSQDRIREVRALSLLTHAGQQDRPDGQPYINHPLAVAHSAIVKYGARDADSVMAALLHDSVEDRTPTLISLLSGFTLSGPTARAEDLEAGSRRNEAFRQIELHCGARVSAMVRALTNPDFEEMIQAARQRGDATDRAELQRQLYKDHFLEIFDNDPEAFRIKLADFSQNAFSLGTLSGGPRKEKLQAKYGPVIVAVIERFEMLTPAHPLWGVKSPVLSELHEVYERDYC